jgi:uncharacterized protein
MSNRRHWRITAAGIAGTILVACASPNEEQAPAPHETAPVTQAAPAAHAEPATQKAASGKAEPAQDPRHDAGSSAKKDAGSGAGPQKPASRPVAGGARRPEDLGLQVDQIGVQYTGGVAWKGHILHDDQTRWKAPDPVEDVYILVVRENTPHFAEHGVEAGKAYRWHGMNDFEYLCDVDLSLDDEAIARQFGAFKDKPVDIVFNAAEQDDVESLRKELAAGISPDIKNRSERPVIVAAARKGSLGVVRLLVEKGADVNAADLTGQAALHAAAAGGHAKVLELLLDSGADLNLPDALGHSALFFAAEANSAPAAKVLIDHGADPAAKDSRGYTPLSYAKVFLQGRMDEELKRLLSPKGSR